MSVPNYFDISTFVEVWCQHRSSDRMLRGTCWPCGLSCRSAVFSFQEWWVRTLIRTCQFVFWVCCVVSCLCDGLVTRSEDSNRLCLCLTVCDLGTSTNSHPSLLFGCSTIERNIRCTYRHSNCSRRLLPAPRQCGCFSSVGLL